MRKGFTLIELIIVIVLFSVLVGFVSWTFVVGLRVWSSGRNRAEMRQQASLALEKMVRELGQASDFTTAQANQVKFDADLDADGSDETITFKVSDDDELIRQLNGTETVLAANVQSFALSYLASNNATMAFPIGGSETDEIQVVVITLTMNNVDETLSLSSSVYTRNHINLI